MYPYRDPALSAMERTEDLLSRMTLEEKVAQLICFLMTNQTAETAAQAMPDGIGTISCLNTALTGDNEKDVETLRATQRYLVEDTRMGIPGLVHNEGLAGAQLPGATTFTQSLGLAASFEPQLAEQVGTVVREQLLAYGIHAVHSPLFDLGRDPRWGRIGETYGEDPYLTAQMGCNYVKGVQGDNRIMATGKHFVGYGLADGGRNGGESQLSERRLLDTYCFPFEASIHDAKIKGMMNSYGILNEEPIATSRRYLTDLLRGKLGFDGLVVADYGSISRAHTNYHTAKDAKESGLQALVAGIDVEQPRGECYLMLADAVRNGELDISYVDTAVRRVLEMKFSLGLFENPYAEGDFLQEIAKAENKALALTIAEKSITLVKNTKIDGVPVLPLKKSLKVAVTGPAADYAAIFFGGYSSVSTAIATSGDFDRSQGDGLIRAAYEYMLNHKREAVMEILGTMPEGDPTPEQKLMLIQRVGEMTKGQQEVTGRTYKTTEDFLNQFYPNCLTVKQAMEQAFGADNVLFAEGCKVRTPVEGGVAAAVKAAEQADVIVACVGGVESMRASDATCGENRDNVNLDLEPVQTELVEALLATGKPVIMVITEGRALSATSLQEKCAAVLYAYLPGEAGAESIVRTLTGDNNPAGRLPVTVVRNASQIPMYYNRLPLFGEEDIWTEYINPKDNMPLYVFGHGLSYTVFTYESLTADSEVSTDGVVHASFAVKNIGEYDGEEVVQIYARQRHCSLAKPERQLVGFARVPLKAGEKKTLNFAMDLCLLAFHNRHMEQVVEPCQLRLEVGASSTDIRLKTVIDVTGPVRNIERKVFTSKITIGDTK